MSTSIDKIYIKNILCPLKFCLIPLIFFSTSTICFVPTFPAQYGVAYIEMSALGVCALNNIVWIVWCQFLPQSMFLKLPIFNVSYLFGFMLPPVCDNYHVWFPTDMMVFCPTSKYMLWHDFAKQGAVLIFFQLINSIWQYGRHGALFETSLRCSPLP